MSPLKKLAVALAASAAWLGSVQATTYDAGTVSPSVYQQNEFFSTGGVSFDDVCNFTVGAEYGTVLTSAVSYSPDGTSGGHVSDLKLSIFAGSDASGPLVAEVSSADGSVIDQSGVLAAGDYSVRISGVADGALGGGYQLSIAAVPEPAEWTMLLAGLAVLGFIARRKTAGLMAG